MNFRKIKEEIQANFKESYWIKLMISQRAIERKGQAKKKPKARRANTENAAYTRYTPETKNITQASISDRISLAFGLAS
jgi:hypothetical protein